MLEKSALARDRSERPRTTNLARGRLARIRSVLEHWRTDPATVHA